MRTAFLAFLFAVVSSAGYADPSGAVRDVSFTARADGSTQHYVLILPEPFDLTRRHDLMIALHGHGSDRWQFATGDLNECRAARDAARTHSMIYVSPDYRAKTSWMGPLAEQDTVQIIEDLKKEYLIGKILLCGASMGGSACLTFAALHPDLIQGVVSMNGTANHLEYEKFQEAISESFGGPKTSIPEEYKKRSAEYWPERLTMPIAFTVGGLDELVPPASVRRLAAILHKIQPNVLILDREQGGHSTTYEDAAEAFRFVIERMKQ